MHSEGVSNEIVITSNVAPQRARTLPALDLSDLREAQRAWAETRVRDRAAWVFRLRSKIASRHEQLCAAIEADFRNDAAETLAAEVIPLADACRFLHAEAPRLLAPSRPSNRQRPKWLSGVRLKQQRDPYGVVLIVGPTNYPLFLPGVQMLQALVAGNAVLLKPGINSTAAAKALIELCYEAGLPKQLVSVLPESIESFDRAIAACVDKVVLTGSATTGRVIQSRLAETLTPATMELSGCDAVFVFPTADVERVAKALTFGLRFNNSATCIAPRRVFVPAQMASQLETRLLDLLSLPNARRQQKSDPQVANLIGDALKHGAELLTGERHTDDRVQYPCILKHAPRDRSVGVAKLLVTDVFAPVLNLITYETVDQALEFDRRCPFALGASIFGDATSAEALAQKLNVGCVVINDMIAPTADPRLAFGGRKQSGFGVTRGAAGLLEMTQLKSVVHQRSRWLPHLDTPTPFDASLLAGFLKFSHGQGFAERIRGLAAVIQAGMKQHQWKREGNSHG